MPLVLWTSPEVKRVLTSMGPCCIARRDNEDMILMLMRKLLDESLKQLVRQPQIVQCYAGLSVRNCLYVTC